MLFIMIKNIYKLLLEDVVYKVEQLFYRRLTIIKATVPVNENNEKAVYKVLLEPKLAKRIAEYMDFQVVSKKIWQLG